MVRGALDRAKLQTMKISQYVYFALKSESFRRQISPDGWGLLAIARPCVQVEARSRAPGSEHLGDSVLPARPHRD
jgi:hypothetical protein